MKGIVRNPVAISIALPLLVLAVAIIPTISDQVARRDLEYSAVITSSYEVPNSSIPPCITLQNGKLISAEKPTQPPNYESLCRFMSAYVLDPVTRQSKPVAVENSSMPRYDGLVELGTITPGSTAPDGTTLSFEARTQSMKRFFFDEYMAGGSDAQLPVFAKEGKKYPGKYEYMFSKPNTLEVIGWVARTK